MLHHHRTPILIQGLAFFFARKALRRRALSFCWGMESAFPLFFGCNQRMVIERCRLSPKTGVRPLKIRGRVRYNKATRIMNRPCIRAAQQKEEEHMQKWMALLLACLLCWCAAGATPAA